LEDSRTKRSKGCGIVTYQDPRDAARAIRELNESSLEGRTIFVQHDKQPGQQQSESQASSSAATTTTTANDSSSIYVGNLSFDCTWQNLKDKFKPSGYIEKADIVANNGKSKGYGKITFGAQRDVQAAIRRFDGADFQGRALIVKPWGSSEAFSLYAGNLSFDCSRNDLKECFRSYGKIDNVEIAEHNGRSKGFGFVDFSSREAAERALNALDGRDFQGRPLKVKWDRDSSDATPAQNDPPGKRMPGGAKGRSGLSNDGSPNTTVHIGNLDFDCRWQDLKQLFGKFGRVEHAEILENPNTKRSKGYGTVQFLTSAEAQRAIDKVNGTEFQNRPIQVKWDRTKGVPEVPSSKSPAKTERAPRPPPKKAKRPEPPAPTLDGALSSTR
jgi:RNA recognition motif-containing protein